MPRYVLQVSWLASTFPDSQIVHIVRDPRDVAASICSAGWKRTLRDAAEYWKERVTEGRRQGRLVSGDRYHEVKYEMLLRNPTETLQELAGHLDIQFRSGMAENDGSADDTLPEAHREAYGELFSSLDRPIDPSRAHAWKKEMTRRDIADVESVAASTMREFGYQVSGATVPLPRRGVRWIKRKLTPIGRWAKRRVNSW
jgi:hypothetical protein